MIVEIALFILMAILPMPLALLFCRRGWSRWKAILISPAPLPGLIAGLCIVVFANAALSSREDCGVDACGMAMMFSMFGGLAALAGYVIGAVFSAGTVWLIGKRNTSRIEATFE